MRADQVLSQFQAAGVETCFHGRHIEPQIYAGLDGANWSLDAYVKRGGYEAVRRMLGADGQEALTQDQIIATLKESGLRGRGGADGVLVAVDARAAVVRGLRPGCAERRCRRCPPCAPAW